MATMTTKLQLTKPDESDYYDINIMNENMDKIDNLVHISESGTKTADKYSLGSTTTKNGTVTWYYKKYDDKTFEAYCAVKVTGMTCNDSQGQDGTWRSKLQRVAYPSIGIKSIYCKQFHIASSSAKDDAVANWIIDVSAYGESSTYSTVRAVSTTKETKSTEKVIYVTIKGTLN